MVGWMVGWLVRRGSGGVWPPHLPTHPIRDPSRAGIWPGENRTKQHAAPGLKPSQLQVHSGRRWPRALSTFSWDSWSPFAQATRHSNLLRHNSWEAPAPGSRTSKAAAKRRANGDQKSQEIVSGDKMPPWNIFLPPLKISWNS